jgi:hypothetical protein
MNNPGQWPQRVVSGGQTGVDRAALDVAIRLGLPHGGWCPLGRLAEDGAIPGQYRLSETRSPRYWVRTRQNVIDSSGTLILCRGPLQGGTELTHRLAQRFAKPCLVVDLAQQADPAAVRSWIRGQEIQVLNVAGPRESTAPGIAQQAEEFLASVLAPTT